ncbi:MAG: winged helix-turn-helix transcriptional regulator, partial [Muribaculaceae bacterium]|nr:winged helix-turn-helix transcriptional regulator [Muribaculaceae bacterium]
IIRLLIDNPRLTRAEIAVRTGLTESGVKKIISGLKDAGIIERIGSNKTGYWAVKHKPTN